MRFVAFLVLIIPCFSAPVEEPRPLYSFDPKGNVDNIPDCKAEEVSSCRKINLDLEVIQSQGDIMIPELGTVLQRRMEDDEDNGEEFDLDYQNEAGDSVVLVMNKKTLSFSGDMHIGDRVFEISSVGKAFQVLMELDESKMPKEEEGADTLKIDRLLLASEGENESYMIPKVGVEDRATTYTVSVKIYYTPEARAAYSDLFARIGLAIFETNLGYRDSGVNIRLVLHCTEQSTVRDNTNSGTVLRAFAASKGSVTALRGGADMALLFVNSLSGCGIAYVNTIGIKYNVGVVRTSCATGYYSFGHEIAHMYGAMHNREVSNGSGSGYGYLIRTRSGAPSGYRTIMAYGATGFRTRINRYSSSSITFNGMALGNSANDNARLLQERRAAMSAVDDQRPSC